MSIFPYVVVQWSFFTLRLPLVIHRVLYERRYLLLLLLGPILDYLTTQASNALYRALFHSSLALANARFCCIRLTSSAARRMLGPARRRISSQQALDSANLPIQ